MVEITKPRPRVTGMVIVPSFYASMVGLVRDYGWKMRNPTRSEMTTPWGQTVRVMITPESARGMDGGLDVYYGPGWQKLSPSDIKLWQDTIRAHGFIKKDLIGGQIA